MKISELKNKKIAILGYGLEGKSTERFLKKLGINDYEILDKNLNKDYLDNLNDFDVIFKSPGISPYNNPELQKVKNKLTSQAEILADNFEGKIIGITGTKGKSTTSTLLYEILKELGYKVKLVGNIGNPVLDEIDLLPSLRFKGRTEDGIINKYDYVIYELSSYMLEGLNLNIEVGLLNNIYDCHLDWHNGRRNYENAKFNVFKNAKVKLAGKELENILKDKFEDIIYFGNDLEKFGIKEEEIALAGEHNYKNISGILNILEKIGIFGNNALTNQKNINNIKKVLKEFTGLEHRQENIGTYKGITFINDAIASTPESAIAAIKTFGEKIGTIFIGNEDSGFDLTKLRETIERYKIPNIVLFPTTGEKLFGEISKNMEFDNPINYNPSQHSFNTKGRRIRLYKTLNMEKAVKFAYENTKKGQYVVLSTGAPSFNADGPGVMPWKTYVEKGEMFKKAVKKYS